MTDVKVVAIGAPPSFRQKVARALGTKVEEVGWMPTVTAAEAFFVDGREGADLLVVSPGVDDSEALDLAEFIGRSSPTTAVILVRKDVSSALPRAAMRAGIRDVVDLSQGNHELRDALARAVSWASNVQSVRGEDKRDASGGRGSIISVFSSKGGTGKTFLASNLAAAIASKSREEVAVVDLDLGMGDIFSYYGKEPSHPLQELVALGDKADRDAIFATGSKLRDNLWGFGAQPDPAAEAVPGPAVGKMLAVFRSLFPHIVVDLGPNYSDHTLAAFDISDTICLVAGLDVVGIKHLSKSLETLLAIGLPRERFRIVLNRADSKVGIDPSDVEKVLGLSVDAMIPSSRLVPTSLNRGVPVYWDEPKSPVSTSLDALASKFVSTPSQQVGQLARSPKRRFLFNLGGSDVVS